ncbi:MAG: hypothetical protein P8Y66_09125 [Nitrospirota bacterium]|jgi:hypothetical protein
MKGTPECNLYVLLRKSPGAGSRHCALHGRHPARPTPPGRPQVAMVKEYKEDPSLVLL